MSLAKYVTVVWLALGVSAECLAADWSEWTRYAEFRYEDRIAISVDWRKRLARGRAWAQWRIVNHTDASLYNVYLGDKTYSLPGVEKSRSGERCSDAILPGERCVTRPDPLGEFGDVLGVRLGGSSATKCVRFSMTQSGPARDACAVFVAYPAR